MAKLTAAQQAAISKAQADYNKAKAAGNQKAMDDAHARADAARGYSTKTVSDGKGGYQQVPGNSGGGSTSSGNRNTSTGGGGNASGGNVTTKTPVTIYNPDGSTQIGYIQNGLTFQQNGARMQTGQVVKAANGKFYGMDDQGVGYETMDPYTNQGRNLGDLEGMLMNMLGQFQQPGIMDAEELSKMYGVSYDFHTINNLLQDAADKKYATAQGEALQNEGKLFDQAYGLQNDLLGTMRKGVGEGVMSGAARGTFDANQLLGLLGWQQNVGDLATEATQNREQLGNVYAQDQATATQMAQEYSNKMGLDLGNLASVFNANRTQTGVGLMDALARMFSSNLDSITQTNVAGMNKDATIKAAEANAKNYQNSNSGYKSGNNPGYYQQDNSILYKTPQDVIDANDFFTWANTNGFNLSTIEGYEHAENIWKGMGKETPGALAARLKNSAATLNERYLANKAQEEIIKTKYPMANRK